MTIDRKFVLKQVRDLVFFFLASLVQAYFMCPRCSQDFGNYILVVAFTFCMWVGLWKGNSYVTGALSRRIKWIEYPMKRFVIGIISTVGYTVLFMVSVMFVFEKGLGFNFGKGYTFTIYGSVIVTILISFFLHARAFFRFWKEATIEKEKFQKESITAKYESLRNQVNPHFLFNSLNALSNLVYEDQDKAVKFIKQLSDVYRYVLDTRSQEVVLLKEELAFLESYLYLQQIRFGDKLKIELNVPDREFRVAPLALQLLIENAIKHNVISEDDPLVIKVYAEQDFIVVENNLQRKQTLGEHSAGLGLENICRRYELLTDRKVVIGNGPEKFIVKVPLLTNAAS
jgi:sensor histidine kinase YesM